MSLDTVNSAPERRHTYGASYHDTEYFNARNPCAHILEVSERPEFRLISSLIWIRTGSDQSGSTKREKTPELIVNSNDRITTRVYESDLGLLSLHRDRLAAAAEALGWRDIAVVQKTDHALDMLRAKIIAHLESLPEVEENHMETRKLRITVSKGAAVGVDSTTMGIYHIDYTPENPFMPERLEQFGDTQSPCQVFVDVRPTRPSLFTTHKTTCRSHYDSARARANITHTPPTEREVLLYNMQGEIMEASLCTVYFYRDNKWITPATICGSLLGVTRRLALDAGLCKQGSVELSELKEGEKIWLSNAARGFFVGQICLDKRLDDLVPDVSDML